MSGKLQVGVIGPTGYSGFELLKILFRHPQVKSPVLFVRERAESGPRNLSDVYPQISGNGAHSLEPFSWPKAETAGIDLLFLATPHEFSREFVPEAIARGVRIIDLSGAWRLKAAENRAAYGFKDEAAGAKFDGEAVYGLPELNSDNLVNAQLVANPGCYPTSIILALAPFMQAGCVDKEAGVICDSKSGVSGAGKTPTQQTHFVEVADNFRAYNPVTHRHRGEILEQLDLEADELVFTPHLLPIPSGMFSTIYVYLKKKMTAAQVEDRLRTFYSGSPFVRVFAPPRLPELAY